MIPTVLLCSPYLDSSDVIKGGINTWGRYVMEYYGQYASHDVNLIPVSFDRKTSVNDSEAVLIRIAKGIHEVVKPTITALKKMGSGNPDVVHICTSAGYGLLRDLILVSYAKHRNAKTVLHLHFGRVPMLVEKNGWEWKLLKHLLCLCDVPVVMNRPSEICLIEQGFYNAKYLPNPLGISMIDIVNQKANLMKRTPRKLLFCGHVLKTKGVIELVEGCCRIPDVTLRIVGRCDEDMRNQIHAIVERNGFSEERIELVGEVGLNMVVDEFLSADMFVFPSYTEGFPNVILEAMACGCPIASSDVGAIPEMLDINGNACGICFKPHSAEEVYNAVSSLIDNEDLKRIYASRARARVLGNYSIQAVWRRMIEIWKM